MGDDQSDRPEQRRRASLPLPWWFRGAEVATTTLGAAVGMSPWLGLTGSWIVTLAVLLVVALVAVLYQIRAPVEIARLPVVSEWVTTFGITVFAFATGSLMLLAVDGVLRLGVIGVHRLTQAFEREIGPTIGFWIAALLAALLIPTFAAMSARQSGKLLHPRLKHRPPLLDFIRGATSNALLLFSAAAFITWIVIGARELFQAPMRFGDAFGLTALLLIASVVAKYAIDGYDMWLVDHGQGEESASPLAGGLAENQVRSLFEVAGYALATPSRERALMARVDFIAKRGGVELVVEVKHEDWAGAVDPLPTASALGAVARVLSRVDRGRYHALLIVLGSKEETWQDEWFTVRWVSQARLAELLDAIDAGTAEPAVAEALVEGFLMEAS